MQSGKEIAHWLQSIITCLVDDPDAVAVECVTERYGLILGVQSSPEQMGQIVGKGGKIIEALRIIAKAAAGHRRNVYVLIEE